MAKSSRQKGKLFLVFEYFLMNTDEEHGVTIQQIIDYLENCGISAERKSIYSDIEIINESTRYEIISEKKDRNCYYKLVGREFETAEVKLLVDSVQSTKLFSKTKKRDLIEKLGKLTSRHVAAKLNRQLIIKDVANDDNKSVIRNVDAIYDAINQNRQIGFKYYKYNMKKELVERHEGMIYKVSPIFMIWDDDQYYLVAHSDEWQKPKHFRVDKMKEISILNEEREIEKYEKMVKEEDYSMKVFGMFTGYESTVTLSCDESLVGVMLDRFGKNMIIYRDDEKRFHFSAKVEVSSQFYGWLAGLGKSIKVESPSDVREGFSNYLQEILTNYKNDEV